MDIRTALRVLIETSDLQPADKERMIAAIPSMTDEDMKELGTALAKQKKEEMEKAARVVDSIDKALAE